MDWDYGFVPTCEKWRTSHLYNSSRQSNYKGISLRLCFLFIYWVDSVCVSRPAMSLKLKRFDVHSKAVDGINEQTVMGALVTLIMYGFIGFLLYSELRVRSDSDVVSRMVLDASGSARRIQSTKIEFDVDFYKISCSRIQFTQEVTRGEHHGGSFQKDVINLVPMLSEKTESCHVFGTLVTDKVGGNFRFEIAELESEANEIRAARLAVPQAMESGGRLFAGGVIIPIMIPPDISHKINHILFLENNSDGIMDLVASSSAPDDVPEFESRPLNGQDCQVPLGTGIHQYSIQVVPTTYMSYKEEPKHLNQYSVTERQIEFEQALSGVMIGGQPFSNFVGVVFTYDFYPVKLILQQKKKASGGFFDYISTMCGVIGGVITVLGLFEGCLHQSTKTLIGKKD